MVSGKSRAQPLGLLMTFPQHNIFGAVAGEKCDRFR